MATNLEYRLRRWARSILAQVGTPPVSLALLALAATYLAVASALDAQREVAGALEASLAFEILGAALLLDGIVGLLRATPIERDAAGKIGLRAPSLDELGPFLLRGAHLLAGAAFVASLLARDVHTIRIAEGETATGDGAQFVDRDPPRRYSSGPFAVSFTVERVEGALRSDGSTDGLSVDLREPDGRRQALGPLRPRWEGLGRVLRPTRAGIVLRYAVAVEKGAELDSAFAKLDLLPAGTAQEVRSEVVPHRLVFLVPPDAKLQAGGRPPLRGAVLRNGRVVGEGPLDAAAGIRFDGLVLTVPEVRRWVEFRMIRDPGLFLAGFAALAASLGGVLLAITRRRAARA